VDDSIMADEEWFTAHRLPARPRQPTCGELLFEFVRSSDHAPMSCELRFHDESYGWEVQFHERGELFASRGGFALRELAVRWAEIERQAIEGRPCAHCGGAGWMCEAHPDQVADHDPTCDGPSVACPHCQPQTSDERPRMPSDWRSVLEKGDA
jgi:hypothetical protein